MHQYRIDKNIPIPPPSKHTLSRKPSKWKALEESMEHGHSVLIEGTSKGDAFTKYVNSCPHCRAVSNREFEGNKFVGVRVWKIVDSADQGERHASRTMQCAAEVLKDYFSPELPMTLHTELVVFLGADGGRFKDVVTAMSRFAGNVGSQEHLSMMEQNDWERMCAGLYRYANSPELEILDKLLKERTT